MYFKQLENITIETNIRGVDSRLINDKNSIIIKQLLLNPHDKIPPHQVPVDVTFFVLEGEGFITIDAHRYPVKPHSIVTCPPNTLMEVEAGPVKFSFLNMKTPGFKPVK